MPLITPDLSEVDSNEIAPGTYAARIKDGTLKTSQAGKEYIEWTLELFGNPTVNNRLVWHRTPFTGKGAFRFQQMYKAAIGQDMDGNQAVDTDSMIGKEITVGLVNSPDQNGRLRTEVKTVTAHKN